MDEDAIKQLLAGMTNRDVDRKLYALGMVSVRTDRMSIDAKREQLLEAFRQGKWNGQKSMDSLHKAMMVGVAKAKREKALAYPSDPDGGGRRVAAITHLERKLAMMERDLALGMVEASRVEKVRQQLADAKDSTKPLK